MKSHSTRKRPAQGAGVKKQAAAKKEGYKIPPVALQIAAYCIIGAAVLLSWFLTPIPVAAGLTILAAVRIVFALREARKAAQEENAGYSAR